MDNKCENCVFCKTNTNKFLPNNWICDNAHSKWYSYWPPTGLCELYKEPNGEKVKDVIPEYMLQFCQEFAASANAMWGNDNGTKGLEKFLDSDSAVIENGEK